MKNKIKRSVALMLCAAIIACVFASCADKPDKEEETANPTGMSAATEAASEETTAEETTAEPTAARATETTTKKTTTTKRVTTTKRPAETKPQPPKKQYSVDILINKDNYIPDDYKVDVVSCGNGHKVDRRAYDDLQAMLSAAESAGYSPVICSSYRTHDYQKGLFERRVKRCMNEEGCGEEEARKRAAKWVAIPGTSEHESGLALDIGSRENQNLDSSQLKSPCQQWLMANSWEYGFILRYPEDKTDITKINFEPWHYRYVGKKLAAELHERGICLEEYYQ